MHMRSRLAFASAVVLLVTAVVAAPAAARDPLRAAHDRVVAHWTAERMAAAQPRDVTYTPGTGFAVGATRQTGPTPTASNSTGQSWPTGGANGGGLIARVSGRVYFELGVAPNISAYVCSGSVATDTRSDRSLVLTAAHCVYDHALGWATYWMFVPQADGLPVVPTCSQSPRGCWTAQSLVAHSGFTSAGGFTGTAARYDFAFAVVGAGGLDGATQLDADSPVDADANPDSLAIGFSGVSKGNTLYAFGYPAAPPYNGTDLVYCSGKITQDLFNGNATWGMTCNQTGGASGGPWLKSFSEANGIGTLASLNSYRYSFSNKMYGPKFNANTEAVYRAADIATAPQVVVP